MYIHLSGAQTLPRCRGFRHLRDGLLHRLPHRTPKPLAQFSFRSFPVRLSLDHLPAARWRQTKETLASVFCTPDTNPALPPQQPQCAGQSGAVHGKAGAQAFLIRSSAQGQGREQAKLRDFEPCLSQLLVIDSCDKACYAP